MKWVYFSSQTQKKDYYKIFFITSFYIEETKFFDFGQTEQSTKWMLIQFNKNTTNATNLILHTHTQHVIDSKRKTLMDN